jgi:hypothetical protein
MAVSIVGQRSETLRFIQMIPRTSVDDDIQRYARCEYNGQDDEDDFSVKEPHLAAQSANSKDVDEFE